MEGMSGGFGASRPVTLQKIKIGLKKSQNTIQDWGKIE
jgi:hypothetical protein